MKERIIGAAVLVTFVVLVVPIFLDGPPQEGDIVTERVLLPGQEDQDTKTVVLDRERSEPIPVASSTQGSTEEAAANTPSPVAENPSESAPDEARAVIEAVAQQPPPAVETRPAPTVESRDAKPVIASSPTGMWAVQLGSFSNKENAEKLAADLRKQAYAAFLSQLQTDNGPLHRVRIGPQKDREAAELMAARLAKVGHKGQVVPHP